MKKKLNDLLKTGELGSSQSFLSENSFANLFDVVSMGEKSYFNLCKGISFENMDEMDSSLYSIYEVVENDCWTNISYKFYKTYKLWWLICKFNNIKNPFSELIPGSFLKIPNDDLKQIILNSIKAF